MGDNTAYLKVTAEDGSTNKVYILTITRESATLSTACDVTTWNTPSNPTVSGTDVSKAVDNGTTDVTIDVNVSNRATWKLYSDSGCSSEIENKKLTLFVGDNTAYLKVTAEDGSTNKVYILTITRESATLSTACEVTTWSTPSSPTVSGTDISKTVENGITELTIDVNVSNRAVWKLYSDSGCSSEIGDKRLTLAVGANTAYLKVTAEDGSTNKVYTLTIIRESATLFTACEVTTWNTPSNPTVSGTDVSKAVDNGTTDVTIDVNVSEDATWKLYSDSGCSSEIADKSLTLVVGANTAYLKVTAEDGSTTKVYSVTITRANALSTACEVTEWNTPSSPTVSGTDISKTVDNGITQLTIDVNVSNGATWKLYSDSGCSSEIADKRLTLSVGDNTAYLKVTAEDESTNKVYTLTITRESIVKVTFITVTGQGDSTTITNNDGTLQMSAEVLPLNANKKEVIWSVDDENIATISETGLLTAVDNGTVTVIATAKDGSGVDGQLVITISGQSNLPAQGTRVEKDSSGQYVVATDQSSTSNPIGLWRIEDLVAIDNDTASLSEDYVLMNDLDFDDRDSYRNPDDTSIDADGDSDTSETIYDELKQDGNTDVGFKPIGDVTSNIFEGNLDGDNHKIIHLYINRSSEDYIGLFSMTTEMLNIENIGIENYAVTGRNTVGALVGSNVATIINSYATGNITGEGVIGGLVGENKKNVINCYSKGSVIGDNTVGGLIGYNWNGGEVTKSYTTVAVEGTSYLGGLVGFVTDGKILNSYSVGKLKSDGVVGGVVGNKLAGEISNCIAFCSELKGGEANRITGQNNGGTLNSNYANSSMVVTIGGTVTPILDGATDNKNGADITAEQFKNSPYNGWDFTPDIDNTGTEKDNDGYYWQMGIDRPILYWFNGSEGVQIGDDDGSIPEPTVTKVSTITVTGEGDATTITENDGTLQISAEVLPTNADNKEVTWSVSDESKAIISETGLLTAVDNGTVTVTANAKDGSGVEGQLEITISGQSNLPAQGTRVEKDSSGQYVVATDQSSTSNPIGLWRIEDLVAIGTDSTSLAESYVLMSDLDFDDKDSYRNPDDTSIDADEDSNNEKIYDELKQSGNTDVGFKPIGKYGSPFTGNFDGGGYKIENLYINRSSEYDIGLFGKTKTTVIKNIGIVNCKVTGEAGVGGLVGWNSKGAIVSNSYSTGNIEGKSYSIGGLIGENDEKVSNCYSTANVKGRRSLGGLIGANANAQVSNSYSTGNVIGIGTESGLVGLGGLIGTNGENGKAENCIAFNGSLSHTSEYVSRVVGDGGGTLTNNYANSSMTVTAGGSAIAISGGAMDNEKGADITAEQFKDNKSSNSPYSEWDFTPDIDNTGTEKDDDGYYWQMGTDRPILYWFNGIEGVQIGNDNGNM